MKDSLYIKDKELYLVFDQTEEVLKKNSKVDQNLIRMYYDVVVKKT